MEKEVHKTELEKKLEAELTTEEAPSEAGNGAAAPEAAADTEEVLDAETLEEKDEGIALAEELVARTAERDELKDQLLRARAEFDNYRKRVARDTEQLRKTAAAGLMRDLLPVVDNLERALAHAEDADHGLAQGVRMVLTLFCDTLANNGLEPIRALGERFDPNVHDAMSHLPSEDYAADVVMEEFERGYRLGDYVLRPARVVVSSGPPQAEESPEAQDTEEENETPETVGVDVQTEQGQD